MSINYFRCLFYLIAVFAISFTACTYLDSNLITAKKLTLETAWQFRHDDSLNWLPAQVPGCIHTDLLRTNLIEDPYFANNEGRVQWIENQDWQYKTYFQVSQEWLDKDHLDLVFEGVDTYSRIYLNGELVGKTDNMFRTWRIDCKRFLKADSNILRVELLSPVRVGKRKAAAVPYKLPNDKEQSGQPTSAFTRKAHYQYGWDWAPRLVTSGIWRPIKLEAWNEARLSDLYIKTDSVANHIAYGTAIFEIESEGDYVAQLALALEDDPFLLGSESFEIHEGYNVVKIPFQIENPELWYPRGYGQPFMYNVIGSISIENVPVDYKTCQVGIRTLNVVEQVSQDSVNGFYIEVNNIPIFAKGANYVPQDVFPSRVTDEQYIRIIDEIKAANMNMVRVWGGGIYEDNLFYDLCDKEGILIWQDFMLGYHLYPTDSAFRANLKEEVTENVKRLRSHPSLALWCGNNKISHIRESKDFRKLSSKDSATLWSNHTFIYDTLLPHLVDSLDAGRYYAAWSPAPISKSTDNRELWSVWFGRKPITDYANTYTRFAGEYGLQSYPLSYTFPLFTDTNANARLLQQTLNWHQRSTLDWFGKKQSGNQTIDEYIRSRYPFDSLPARKAYLSQVMQAEGIQIAIESHRQARPYCMGSLYWQLNDCWPAISWSSLDYWGNRKAAWYAARKAFSTLVLIPHTTDSTVTINMASDSSG